MRKGPLHFSNRQRHQIRSSLFSLFFLDFTTFEYTSITCCISVSCEMISYSLNITLKGFHSQKKTKTMRIKKKILSFSQRPTLKMYLHSDTCSAIIQTFTKVNRGTHIIKTKILTRNFQTVTVVVGKNNGSDDVSDLVTSTIELITCESTARTAH